MIQELLLQTIQGTDKSGITNKRLDISIPLRHGKSLLVDCWFILWFLLGKPDGQVILVSAGTELATFFGGLVRDYYQNFGPQLTGYGVSGSKHSADHWHIADKRGNHTGGSFQSKSVGSKINGWSADLIIIDDAFASYQESYSPVYRDKVWNYIVSSAIPRLKTPDCPVVHISSRYNTDDLRGRFEEAELNGGDRWTRLTLPALAGQDDPLGRAEGEALWPERWPEPALQSVRQKFEAQGQIYLWEAMYQCNPLAGDGSATEWPGSYFEHMIVDPHIIDDAYENNKVYGRFLALDPAKGIQKRVGCYACFVDVTMLTERGLLFVKPHLLKVDTSSLEEFMVNLIKDALERKRPYDGLVVEGNGSQDIIARNIMEKCQKELLPCPMHCIINTQDKEFRIRAQLTPLFHQGRVKILAGRDSRLFLNQLRTFPSNIYKDGPDALELCCQLINKLLNRKK